MFLEFFYLLRARELSVTINEWMTLMEALDRGLGKNSLTGFYRLCRSILIKTEADFDKFDQVFMEYFGSIATPEDLPKEFWDWLAHRELERDLDDHGQEELFARELEELMRMFRERIQEQKEEHHGGNYWIGTGGTSPMGRGGYNPSGIRVGGESRHRSALQVAGERNFKDFREDTILGIRQFQMAFRKLRQYSTRVDTAEKELDLDETIDETCNNAGRLSLEWRRPRKNSVKVLLLIDSDGSMLPYSRICNRLFQAVSKSNHFKDLQVYYFHNAIYDYLYTTPRCKKWDSVDTMWVLRKLDSEYKVIFVGDAAMAPSELHRPGGNAIIGIYNRETGIEWFNKFRRRFKKLIWLNPIDEESWDYIYGSATIRDVRELFPMYELSVSGLEAGLQRLMVR